MSDSLFNRKPEIEEELINFSVSNLQIKHLRLLMYRPVGAGKSSFVNSVDSAFQNRVSSKAIMGTASDTSYTKAVGIFHQNIMIINL